MTDIYITLSTSVLQLTATPQTVLLSTLNAPGAIFTVLDTAGLASPTNPITVSTTKGNRFYDGTSSVQITQRYGYVSVNPKTSTLWTVQNSFAFPQQQATAQILGLNTAILNASSINANSFAVSSMQVNQLTTSTLSTIQNMYIRGNLSTNSTVQIGGLLQVANLSVMNHFTAMGGISTIGSVAVGSTLTVRQQSVFGGNVSCASSVQINGGLSTFGTLFVAGETTIGSSLTVNGSLRVNQTLFASSITIQSSLNATGTSVFDSINFLQNNLFASTVSTSALLTTGFLNAQSATVLNTFNFGGSITFSNTLNVFSTMTIGGQLNVNSNATIQNMLIATSISSINNLQANTNAFIGRTLTTSSLFVQTAAYLSGPTIFGSSLGVSCNAPRYTVDVNGTVNASNYFINGLPLDSGAGISTLIVSSLSIKQSMVIGGARLSASSNYDAPTLFTSRDSVRNWSAIGMSSNGAYQLASVGTGSGFLYTSFDNGNNWQQRGTSQVYQDVAVSGTGQYQIATVSNAAPVFSSDYGQTWTVTGILGKTCAISSNAQYVYTAVNSTLYLSADAGGTYISTTFSTDNPVFNQVATSATGQFITLASSKGMYSSSDYGATFTSTLTTNAFTNVSMSANGTYLTVIRTTGGPNLLVSSDSGANYSSVDSTRAWNSVALSATGQYQVATVSSGFLFSSSNYGSSWISTLFSSDWADVATSADGTNVSVVLSNGSIYVKESILTIDTDTSITGNLNVGGFLTKAGGSFEIPHPIKPFTLLTHSFIEGPRADLLYRGRATLRQGQATVNVETSCTANGSKLTPGTFVALATNSQLYLQNNDTFDAVRGTISANIISIHCENLGFQGAVDWMVMAERHDPIMKKWNRTDDNGFLVLEHLEHSV